MKKTKKIMTLVMALTMSALTLAGCGGKETSTIADDESKPYEINWAYAISPDEDLEMVNEKVNEYVSNKINATVKMMPLDAYNQKINNMMNSGEKLDLFWQDGTDFLRRAFDGELYDITDIANEYAPKTMEALGELMLKGSEVNGRRYSIPANKDKAQYTVVAYRKDIADKHGIDMSGVKTLKDLYPILDIIKEKETGMTPFGVAGAREVWTVERKLNDRLFASDYFGITEEDDKIISFFESDLFKNACVQAHEMYNLGYIYKDCAIIDNLSEQMKSGKVFCWLEQSMPGKMQELSNSYGYDLAEVQLTPITTSSLDTNGSHMVIPFNCENPVRVMKFVELLNTDEYLNRLINFGIEGVHFDSVSEDVIKKNGSKGYKNVIGMHWMLGNTFLGYTWDNEDPEKFTKIDAFNNESTQSDYLGFFFNPENVESQMTACNIAKSEYFRNLTYGAVDPEVELPKFISKLKAAGIDDIIAEAQKQFDEWKALK